MSLLGSSTTIYKLNLLPGTEDKKLEEFLERGLEAKIISLENNAEYGFLIREQYSSVCDKLDCSFSSTLLASGLYPVVDVPFGNRSRNSSASGSSNVNNSTLPGHSEVLRITNNNKKSKLYYNLHYKTNPKFELIITPQSGKIRENESADITIQVKAFCTTKLYQLIRVTLSRHEMKEGGEKKKLGFFRSLSNKKVSEQEYMLSTYIWIRIESELSTSLDYDELQFGTKIASGAYGTVFKAEWRGCEVAVKVLHYYSELVEEEREVVQREMKLMSKLNFPYIVTYMGATAVPSQPLAMVMEYIKGGTVTKLLNSTTLTEWFKCKLALDVARGMAFLHSHNIFHRDLKPDNMLLVSPHSDADVNVKLTDFGTSRAAERTQKQLENNYAAFDIKQLNNNRSPSKLDLGQTEERQLTKGVGTLIYQAPEILKGSDDYDIAKTDVFSFGVFLWQVFMQEEPYKRPPYDKWTNREIADFVIQGNRLDFPESIPAEIRDIIGKCWSQNPQERPKFGILVKDIQSVMDGSPNIAWNGNITREETEKILSKQPAGTFLTRWSENSNSYVISYKRDDGKFGHIAHILPTGVGQGIKVTRKDGSKAEYKDLTEYVQLLQSEKAILMAYGAPQSSINSDYEQN